MVLNELATNAAEYGALPNDAGRVGVNWSVVETGETPKFVMHWREESGPRVAPPTRKRLWAERHGFDDGARGPGQGGRRVPRNRRLLGIDVAGLIARNDLAPRGHGLTHQRTTVSGA